MNLHDIIRLFRTRWLSMLLTAIATVSASVLYTALQTPLYESSTRLFVSASSGASASEVFQGMRYSQERVFSYTQLIMGQTLAQRTVDRLNLPMTASQLKEVVTAKARPDTVLIDVSVRDPSPVRARDIANALSDEFVLMARELETPAPGAKPDARVVVEQRASIPEKPVVPAPTRNIAVGLILGIMLGIGLAILRELLDNTVKSEETIEELTGASAVGFVPFEKTLSDVPAISFDVDNTSAAEAFRKLRTNLQFVAVDRPPRLIVVTSASPSEGKTTTSINLALALAEAGHKVALVDGDLRRPRLARYLGLVGSAGFSNILSGGATLRDVIQVTKYQNLSVLASGPVPPNPSELLGSLAAKRLLAELREQFDYVIVDSAPLLAVSDGAVIAAASDGTLIAVRAGKTKRDQLAHAVGILRNVNAELLGAVLTMIPTRGSGSYNYSYYGYGYGNSYGDGNSASRKQDAGQRDADEELMPHSTLDTQTETPNMAELPPDR